MGAQFAIIGAGIAGLGAAMALVRAGVRSVHIFERDVHAFLGASASNAGIFRPLEDDLSLASLAVESLSLLQELSAYSETPLLRTTGLLLLHSREERFRRMRANARVLNTETEFIPRVAKSVWGGKTGILHEGPGLWCPEGAVFDAYAIGQALLRFLRENGVDVTFSTPIDALVTSGATCGGVRLLNGRVLNFDGVILAGGAASARLGFAAGSSLPLIPVCRHLAILQLACGSVPHGPVVWDLEQEVYFRPESGDMMVSPCDETPVRTNAVSADITRFDVLDARLGRLHSSFSEAKVRTYWACVRVKTPDNRPIIGADAFLKGLYWIGGLGGFGMTCGLGAGRRLARVLTGGAAEPHFDPGRFF